MKRMKRRALVRDTTSSIGRGPLSFDADMARRHGWTEREINRCWERLSKVYSSESWRSTKRHPELYARCADGTVVFIGPDENGRTLDRKKFEDK